MFFGERIFARMEATELTSKRIWQLETEHAYHSGGSGHGQLLASSPFGHNSASLAFRGSVGSLEDAPGIGYEKAPVVLGCRPRGPQDPPCRSGAS